MKMMIMNAIMINNENENNNDNKQCEMMIIMKW